MQWERQGKRIPIKSWCETVEPGALRQVEDLAAHPMTFRHVALMPDCHVGYGMPIGGVIACEHAVIPNAVGVDIGCGVLAARTDLPAEAVSRPVLRDVLEAVRRRVPVGFKHHTAPQAWEGWDRAPRHAPPVAAELDSARCQLGTLGGGNHFLEVQAGDDGRVWLMIHSGSRNFGLKIAEHYHALARQRCARRGVALPSDDLACLELDSAEARAYLAAMHFALEFARENRARMLGPFAAALHDAAGGAVDDTLDVHHNYAARERHFGREVMVHRKGATAARADQPGIIPGSMGAPSYLVRGKGNPESFASCSHGAGRRLGRNAANRALTVAEAETAMQGVVHGPWGRDRQGRVDLSEAPQAYKDIDAVMAAQADLVTVTTRLRPLAVIKG
jgi:tRNA-splicing ligase RtcB (3'-phosphate/5'-hydroxy nucleic acid ligase)